MTSSQVGKTTLLENIIGYFIHYEPSPILMVQPTLSMAQSFSKDRLSSMIRDCPVLANKVKPPRERDSGNTVLHKVFTGGHISLVGSNSTSSLASRPIRVLLLDEVDRFEVSNTDCEEPQTLEFKQVKFDKEKLHETHYACRFCNSKWNDSKRWKAIRQGEWKATAEHTGIAGFHLNEFYSSWSRLEDIVRNFLEAKKLPETLKVFTNTTLGESWEDKGTGLDISLNERTEDYNPEQMPDGVLLLTAGVDVQANRLECTVLGIGLNEEIWVIDHIVLYGDPSVTSIWLKLDAELKRTYTRQDGKKFLISSACIDSGYYTNNVYAFCKGKVNRRIYAVKGVSGNKPIFPRRASTNNIMKTPLFTVGVDSSKDIILQRMKIEKVGNGYVHFPKHLDTEYFLQLQSERIKTKYIKGVATREWVQIRKRNEAWDCFNYAYISFISLNANLDKIKESLQTKPKEQPQRTKIKKNFITNWRD